MHFFHSTILHKIASESSYFTPIYFPFSFLDNSKHFDVLGLESGKSYSGRVVFYDLPFDFKSEFHVRNLERLLVTINNDFHDCVYIEIRNLGNLKPIDQNILNLNYKYKDWYNIITDTSNAELTWNAISGGKQRQIKSSFKNGVEIFEAGDESEVKEFYQILKKLYNNKIHKPLPDWNFFRAFYHETKNTEFGRILLAKHNDRVISGIVCPVAWREEAYEWYIAGMDKEYKGTGIYPSVMATWAGIDYAIKKNIPRFNFMGAGQPGKSYGVRDFKLQFGGKLDNVGRYIKINNPFLYNLGKLYINFRQFI